MYLLAAAGSTIECSRARTFDYAANLANFSHWFPGVVDIAALDDVPFAVTGKTYREAVSVPLRGTRSVIIRVVDAVAPQRLITEGDLPLLLPRMEIEFADVGTDRCEVRWRMLSRNENALPRIIALPIARRIMRRRARVGLGNLKQLLESDIDR